MITNYCIDEETGEFCPMGPEQNYPTVYISIGFIDENIPGEWLIVDPLLYPNCLVTGLGIYEFDDKGIPHLIAINTFVDDYNEFMSTSFEELIDFGKSVPAGTII